MPIMGLDLGKLKFNDTRNIFSRSSVGSLSREVIDRFAVKLSCDDCLEFATKRSNIDFDASTFFVVSFRGLPLGRDGFTNVSIDVHSISWRMREEHYRC